MKVILIVCRIRLSQGNRNKIQKSLSCMHIAFIYLVHATKLLQKSEMRKDIVIELSYKGFS